MSSGRIRGKWEETVSDAFMKKRRRAVVKRSSCVSSTQLFFYCNLCLEIKNEENELHHSETQPVISPLTRNTLALEENRWLTGNVVLEDLTTTLPSLSLFISRQREQSDIAKLQVFFWGAACTAVSGWEWRESWTTGEGVHPFRAWTFMGAMNVFEAHACVKTKQVDLAKQQAMKGWPS